VACSHLGVKDISIAIRKSLIEVLCIVSNF
jgi:hypothetical protein